MRKLYVALIISACVSSALASPTTAFDRYGRISWEDEKARLDNFAIHLTMFPNTTGYFLVRAGKSSCKGEAQDHGIRAKNYLMKVRHIPWNRVIWRDNGYGDEFEVVIWLVPHDYAFDFGLEYDAATPQHVIRNCRRRR